MPCGGANDYDHQGTTQADMSEIRGLRGEVQRLTRENDELREKLLRADRLTDVERQDIERRQIAHRRADLVRLERIFRKTRDAPRLGKVLLADERQPLGEQLGFSPDAF